MIGGKSYKSVWSGGKSYKSVWSGGKSYKSVWYRVGALQNAPIFFCKFFYIELFSDPKIDKIKKIWLKKNLF
jgi:hypothetical protein